jgi:hypothetical protein
MCTLAGGCARCFVRSQPAYLDPTECIEVSEACKARSRREEVEIICFWFLEGYQTANRRLCIGCWLACIVRSEMGQIRAYSAFRFVKTRDEMQRQDVISPEYSVVYS